MMGARQVETACGAVLTQSSLVGRDVEIEQVEGLVRAAGSGGGGALLLRGDAGIGKSSLLGTAVAAATDANMRILRATGVRTEANLPFAGLHQLLRPILGGLDRLPGPQLAALGAAFGLVDGAPSQDPFLVGLATLTLLTDAAAERPILVAVDDAQWLDRPSDEVLAFVARRLGSDAVFLLAAIREGEVATAVEVSGLPIVELQPLADRAARDLLKRHARDLAPAARERVLREAAGNPLALVELPGTVGASIDDPVEPIPVTARVEQAFAAQMGDLPEATCTLLLVAAVDDQGILGEILAAAQVMGAPDDGAVGIQPAIDAGLVVVDNESVRFRHPLVRSATAQRASATDRRAAHAALAGVVHDPDRVAWHTAAAATGPDEAVASLLEEAAQRAERRGAIAVATAALERAARLSPDSRDGGGRLLRAADLAYKLGRFDMMLRILRDAQPLDVPALETRRLAWLRALELSGPKTAREAAEISLTTDAAERAIPEDREFALALIALASARAFWIDAPPSLHGRIVDVASAAADDPDQPWLLYAQASASRVFGPQVIERLQARLASPEPVPADEARVLGTSAMWVGELDAACQYFAASVGAIRGQGRLGMVARGQVLSGWCATHIGRMSDAGPALDEGLRLSVETNQQNFVATAYFALTEYRAHRGDIDGASQAVADAERHAREAYIDGLMAHLRHARGVLDLAAGRHADAYASLRHIYEPGSEGYHTVIRGWAIADLADSAVPAGRTDEAMAYLDALQADAPVVAGAWQGITLAYARAVLAADGGDVDAAEAAFETAIAANLERWPLPRARLLLAYGSWLRRQRRVAESREPLRTARDLCDAMGVPWLGERARRELGASGEVSRTKGPVMLDELTPQELQIARLAADGLSNREIGERLYLSHRTVGFHLYHVYPKLGISSRAQLHAALAVN
jgi:DNA-binding CsgD family transcriptional regulator